MAISAYEAVALLSQVGTPSPTQREHNGLASTAYMRPADSGAGFGACRPWFWWLQNILLRLDVWRLAPSPPLAAAEPLVLAWLAVLGARLPELASLCCGG